MFKFFSLPCAGRYETGFVLAPGAFLFGGPPTRIHPTLQRRVNRYVNCPGLRIGRAHLMDVFKNTVCHYFVEVGRFRMTIKPGDTRPTEVYIPGSNFCVYLGKYNLYWNQTDNQPHYAHNMGDATSYALNSGPFVPGVDILWIRMVSPETRAFFLTPRQLEIYTAQERFLAYRKKWHEDCKARTYPPDPPPPQRTVYSPLGPLPWTGKPMRELTPPTPEAAPTTPEQAASMATPPMRLRIEFSLNDPPPPEGFNLTLISE